MPGNGMPEDCVGKCFTTAKQSEVYSGLSLPRKANKGTTKIMTAGQLPRHHRYQPFLSFVLFFLFLFISLFSFLSFFYLVCFSWRVWYNVYRHVKFTKALATCHRYDTCVSDRTSAIVMFFLFDLPCYFLHFSNILWFVCHKHESKSYREVFIARSFRVHVFAYGKEDLICDVSLDSLFVGSRCGCNECIGCG